MKLYAKGWGWACFNLFVCLVVMAVALVLNSLYGQTYPPVNPPDYQSPPLPAVRGGAMTDPQTGTKLLRVTLDGDIAAANFWSAVKPSWYAAGNMRACSAWTLVDGGYLCEIPTTSGGPGLLYWFNPTTEVVQFRGVLFMPGNSDPVYGWSYVGMEGGIPTDPVTPGVFWQVRSGWLMRGVYQNPGAEVPQNTAAKIAWTKHENLAVQFKAQYPNAVIGPGGLVYMNGDFFTLQARMYWQDSPGVVSIYSLSKAKFVGSVESWSTPECRWCGLHSTVPVETTFPVVNIVVQSLCGGAASGPYSSKLTQPVAAADTAFLMNGEPQNEDPINGPRQLQPVAVGDRIGVEGCHGTQQEVLTITAKASNAWTVKRGSNSKPWPVGTRLVMIPNSNAPDYWYDPVSNKLVPDPNQASSHRVTRQPHDVNADYSWRTFNSFQDLATKPWDGKWSWVIPGTGAYSTVQHQRHPSVTADGRVYDIYSVYPQSANVTPMSPSMGALLSWRLTDLSIPNSVKIETRLFSSPVMPNLSLYANAHPIGNSGWVMAMGANEAAVFVVKVGSGPVTPPPPPLAPVITRFDVFPITITAGGSATLTWQTTDTTSVTVSGIGSVSLSGSLSVHPTVTTAYTLAATNPSAAVARSLVLAVIPAPPPPTDPVADVLKRVSAIETELAVLRLTLPAAQSRIAILEAALAKLKAALQ